MADVLIIDDDIDIAEALAALVESLGHEARIGINGRQGMDLIEVRVPDLALIDVEMPILTGPEMVYAMILHNLGVEEVPVILLSGVPDLLEVAKRVGTPYFLGKPYHLADLVALIGRALVERVPPIPQAREHV